MNCYLCEGDRPRPAVAICPSCQIGLCKEHRIEMRSHNQGGVRWTCNHRIGDMHTAVG